MLKSFRLLCLIFFVNSLAGQQCSVEISFPTLPSHSADVSISISDVRYEIVHFRFPDHVPGSFQALRIGLLCQRFLPVDSLGNILPFERSGENCFKISNARSLRKITYSIHDSWTFPDSSILLPQIGTHFDPQNHVLLNPAAAIGFFDGFQNTPIRLLINKPPQLDLQSSSLALEQNKSDFQHSFRFESYYQMIDYPIAYFKGSMIPFSIGGTIFRLSVFSESGKVKPNDVMPIIRPVVEGVWQFCHEFTSKEYTFIIQYVNPETNRQGSDEVYGAVQHKNTSIFYLPETSDKWKLTRDIQYTSAHELFHLFKPLNIKTDATSKLNLKAIMPTAHLWLFEGVTEYLSLLMLYRQDLITQNEFLTEIRNKISLLTFQEPFNLTEVSEQIHLENSPKKYANFYNKGAVVAFLMDLELLRLSGGKMSLLGLLLRLNKNSRDRYVLEDKMVIPELVRLSYPEMETFFNKYVESDSSLNYNSFLNTIGLIYENHRIDTQYLYANAQYRYNKQKGEIYMTQINLNNVGFRDGDVLLKINNRKVSKENIDFLLQAIEQITYQKAVIFTIRRNGQILRLKGDPMLVNKVQSHLIRADKDIKPKKVRYSKSFKSGNYRLEKMK